MKINNILDYQIKVKKSLDTIKFNNSVSRLKYAVGKFNFSRKKLYSALEKLKKVMEGLNYD